MTRWAQMKLWAPAIAWAVVLFWLSHRPGSDLPTLFEGADKLAHFALYAPLGAVAGRALRGQRRMAPELRRRPLAVPG